MLLCSPERLNNPAFRDEVLPRLAASAGLVVVDEAHCISDWGHDFRPDYRRIRTLLADLPDGIPVLATTATANARVTADVAEQLRVVPSGPAGGRRPSDAEVLVLRGGLDRPSLHLAVVPLPDASSRLAWLIENLGGYKGSGIVYCLTVAAAEQTATQLRAAGYPVASYTGQTDPAEREQLRGRSQGEPGQGAGGDIGTRDGVRQAGPGLRHPSRRAAVADRVLPAGRSRRPRGGARRCRAAARGARTRRSGTTSARWGSRSSPMSAPRSPSCPRSASGTDLGGGPGAAASTCGAAAWR